MEALKRAALDYAADGYAVFLLQPDRAPWPNCRPCWAKCHTSEERERCTCLSCHGFYAATTDPERIDAMFIERPRSTLAVRTGAVSNLVVIDVDVKNDRNGRESLKRWAAEFPELLATRIAITASGGQHHWLSHPGGAVPCSVGRMGVGLDVRGDGGYVLAAPSVLDDGRSYRWYRDVPAVPMSLDFKHALEQVLETLRQRRQGRGGGPAGVNAGGSLGQLCGAVRAAPSGERNNILHWAACWCGPVAGGPRPCWSWAGTRTRRLPSCTTPTRPAAAWTRPERGARSGPE
jgi:hypothetical protein